MCGKEKFMRGCLRGHDTINNAINNNTINNKRETFAATLK